MTQQSNFFKFDRQANSVNQLAVIIEILKTYNCRASEALSAEWSNFYPNKRLILIGKKNSSNVIVRDRFILEMISQLPQLHSKLIFPAVTYSHLYHHVKRYYSHLFSKFKGKKNHKVTHGWRYSAVEDIDNDKIIRDILNHRSVKSGKYYKTNPKGGSNEKVSSTLRVRSSRHL